MLLYEARLLLLQLLPAHLLDGHKLARLDMHAFIHRRKRPCVNERVRACARVRTSQFKTVVHHLPRAVLCPGGGAGAGAGAGGGAGAAAAANEIGWQNEAKPYAKKQARAPEPRASLRVCWYSPLGPGFGVEGLGLRV